MMRAFTIAGAVLCAYLAIGAGLAVAGQDHPASAPTDASPWHSNDHSRVRLIRAGTAEDGSDLAGLMIDLDEGWHTYWRSPGSFGIPPTFNWEGSENIRGVDVRWPEPQHLVGEWYEAYGYEDQIVLPLVIARENPDESAVLRLALGYAVCETVCIPATGFAAIAIPAGDAPADERFAFLVQEALWLVPTSDPDEARLNVTQALMVRSVAAQRVLRLSITSPDAITDPRIIMEGPKGIRFGEPKLVLDPTGRNLEAIIAVNITPQAEGVMGPALRATISGGARTLEVPISLQIVDTTGR